MKKILLLVFSLAIVLSVRAQDRTITGRVTSQDDGTNLPGVNVVVKGTTNGTVTDSDGSYRINVSGDGTLVFSFIGLSSQEVSIGGRSVIDLQMATDVKQLNEVVVTAVGIERQQKALGYGVEKVNGSKLQQVSEPDPLRALQGKIAGVNITGS